MKVLKKIIKFIIFLLILFGLSWLPLAGAYNYESALCTALSGLIFIPMLQPESSRESRLGLVKTLACAVIFWLISNGVLIGTAYLRGELCDFAAGVQYQLLLALPSNVLASLCWGMIARVSKRRLIRIPVYLLIIAADFGFAVYALWNWPPIVTFGQFFGYFAGSVYDESIDVMHALQFYRLGTFVLIVLLALSQTGGSGVCRRVLLPIIGFGLTAGYHVYLSESGEIVPIGREQLNRYLWASVSAPDGGFRVHYLPHSKSRLDMEQEKRRLLRDYARDYAYLSSFFGTRPTGTIDIWLYPTVQAKGKYFGAERTSFARVWKNEIHLVESGPRSTLARHEMAHLFAVPFGQPFHGLAGAWNIPAMGWAEGLAVAAEWPHNTFSIHTWSQALLENKELFGTVSPSSLLYGFWGMPARAAYTLAGSFTRYLIDRFGMDKVKLLSRTMPGSFEDIAGISVTEAMEDWKTVLRTHYRDERAVYLAPAVFGASSIWTKHCARSQAVREQKWYQCLSAADCPLDGVSFERLDMPDEKGCRGDSCSRMLHDAEQMYHLYMMRGPIDPVQQIPLPIEILDNAGLFMDEADALRRNAVKMQSMPTKMIDMTAPQFRSAIAALLNSIPEENLPPSAKIIWAERRADMMWHAHQDLAASIMYRLILWTPLTDSVRRRIEIKEQAARTYKSDVSAQILRWFTSADEAERIAIPEMYPHVPILAYLDFYASMHRKDFERARRAWTRLWLSHWNSDPACTMTPGAYRELFRLAPEM